MLGRLFLLNPFSYAFLVARGARARTSPARGLRLMRWCSGACLRCFPCIRESIERAVAFMLGAYLNDDPRRVRDVSAAIVRELFEAEFGAAAVAQPRIDEVDDRRDGVRRRRATAGGAHARRPADARGLHFGNLMLPVTKLRFMIPDDRKLMVILHRDAPGAFFDDALRLVAEYGAGEVEFIDIEERVHLRRLITSLRREAPVFLLFSDLHGKFGKTNRCRLGGRWVRMAGGGVKLAVEQGFRCSSRMRPACVPRCCAVHFTERGQPARAMLGADDDASPVRATHQRIVDRLEQALVRQPEQWHFWEHFTPYLMPARSMRAASLLTVPPHADLEFRPSRTEAGAQRARHDLRHRDPRCRRRAGVDAVLLLPVACDVRDVRDRARRAELREHRERIGMLTPRSGLIGVSAPPGWPCATSTSARTST